MMLVEHETQIDQYSIKLGTIDGEQYCHIRLLPYGPLLFRAEFDWLLWTGYLEDGDATWTVDPLTVEKIKDWAVHNGYEIVSYD